MLRENIASLEGHRLFMDKEGATRVVLADDHDVVRQGLQRLLSRAPEIEVVGEASNGLEALKTVEELHPDVLLLDIEMPGMDGIEVARRLQQANNTVRILILSAYDDQEYISALLDIGVSGYLVKGEAPGKIVEAVLRVADGKKGMVSSQIRKKLEKMQPSNLQRSMFNQKELSILHLLAAQVQEKGIARELGISETELSSVIQELLQKLRVTTRQEAVEVFRRQGWL